MIFWRWHWQNHAGAWIPQLTDIICKQKPYLHWPTQRPVAIQTSGMVPIQLSLFDFLVWTQPAYRSLLQGPQGRESRQALNKKLIHIYLKLVDQRLRIVASHVLRFSLPAILEGRGDFSASSSTGSISGVGSPMKTISILLAPCQNGRQ